MQEKDMVNDVLSMVNSSLAGYASVITQTSDQQLRQTIQQIRDHDEKFQFELYRLAEQKGYYQPAQQADPKDIQQVKSIFGGSEMTGGMTGRREMGTEEMGGRSRMNW